MDILTEALLGHALAEAKASDEHYLPIESGGGHLMHNNLPLLGSFKYEGTLTIGLASAIISFNHFMKPSGPVNNGVDWCRYLQGSIEATFNRFTPRVIKGGKKGIKKRKSGWHTGARFINRPDTYACMFEAFVNTTFVKKVLDNLRKSMHDDESQPKSQKKKRKASKMESESSGAESETTGTEGPRRSPRKSKPPMADAEQPETEEAQPPKDKTKAKGKAAKKAKKESEQPATVDSSDDTGFTTVTHRQPRTKMQRKVPLRPAIRPPQLKPRAYNAEGRVPLKQDGIHACQFAVQIARDHRTRKPHSKKTWH
jgi:hypothetical protein